MAVEEAPLTRAELRAELREELDRTLRHYATKADLAALETRLTGAMAELSAAHTAAMASQTRWLAGLVLAAATAAAGVVIAVDRLAG
ncbi:MAG: hypothetical protein OXP73_10590 [Chloroflexota bacterium]|nr:hypothetical protein [Chloroflexota bacterium]